MIFSSSQSSLSTQVRDSVPRRLLDENTGQKQTRPTPVQTSRRHHEVIVHLCSGSTHCCGRCWPDSTGTLPQGKPAVRLEHTAMASCCRNLSSPLVLASLPLPGNLQHASWRTRWTDPPRFTPIQPPGRFKIPTFSLNTSKPWETGAWLFFSMHSLCSVGCALGGGETYLGSTKHSLRASTTERHST